MTTSQKHLKYESYDLRYVTIVVSYFGAVYFYVPMSSKDKTLKLVGYERLIGFGEVPTQ